MNVEPPETLVVIESIVYKSNGFAIFKKPSYLEVKTLVKLQYIIQLGSFNLYCKILFSLIATDVKQLTVVGEAFQSRNI